MVDVNGCFGSFDFFRFFRIIVINLLFISSHNLIQKLLLLVPWKQWNTSVTILDSQFRQFMRKTHFPFIWIFPMAFKHLETVFCLTSNKSASFFSVRAGFRSKISCNSSSSNFFGCPQRSLSFFLNCLNQYSHVLMDQDEFQWWWTLAAVFF